MTPCPDEDALNALASGLLSRSAADDLAAHAAACAECAALLDDLRDAGDEGHPSPNDSPNDGRAELPLSAGEPVGRYVVRSIIGQGGMGTVYLAEDPELGRRVALKVLRAGRAPGPADRARLSREARTMAKLAHPGIVNVFDAGDDGGRFYIAMQLVEGGTLASWLASDARSLEAILGVFVAAGRALAAAHAAGIVHRDFKPENVLIDPDGRALVTDFGVAAGLDDGAPRAREPTVDGPAQSGRPGEGPGLITLAGHAVGTPRYMAPEQQRGSEVTPASDQYSFCVSLYEALASRPPFDAEPGPGALGRLLQQKLAGPPPFADAERQVPTRLREVVLRGLSPRPEDRFLSMAELVDALEAASPARRATWRTFAVAFAAVSLASLAAVGWLRRAPASDPCAHPEAQLAGVWDDTTRAALRTAFVAAGRSYAGDTAQRASERLDAYASAWTSMRRDVCVASGAGKARGDSVGLSDLCLDRRRGKLAALTRLLTERPDGEVVDKAVQAVSELPPVASCADREALSGLARRPEDPALAARVVELERRADGLSAEVLAGRGAEGVALGEPLLAEVRTVPYAPLRAEVELALGELHVALADFAVARVRLRDAAVSAAEGHDDRLEAKAWARLLFLISEHQQRLDEAAVVYELGGGPVARAHDPLTEAAWLTSVGAFLGRKGSYDASKAAYQRVIELREAHLDPSDPLLGVAYHNMAALFHERAEWAEAKRWNERALAVKERALGPDHPSVALSLNNLGVVLAFMGEEPRALELYDRALATLERMLGPEHPRLAMVLCNIGEARRQLGDPRGSIEVLRRALAIREKALGPDHPDVASPLVGLGRAMVQSSELTEAEPMLRRALALREKALGPSHHELATPLLGLGELAVARGAPAAAVPVLTRALALGNPKREAEIHVALGEALAASGDGAGARVEMEKAAACFTRAGNARAAGKATAWLGQHAL